MKYRFLKLSLASATLVLLAHPALAQWAVIDAPAIVQLVQEVADLEQQIELAKQEVDQARQEWQSITGDRGMQNLLRSTQRNYLPSSWAQFGQAANGSGPLGADVQSAVNLAAVLSPTQISALPPAAQKLLQAARQGNALHQAVSHAALANSSDRFDSLQHLIDAIGGAADQKAVLDLTARVNVELGMLQNEQTKLQQFAEASRAQASSLNLQVREQVIGGHGQFRSRFQPAP